MADKYCYKIENKKKKKIDSIELKKFVRNLYIGEGKFNIDEKLPFLIIHVEDDICIVMTSKSQKNINRIQNIHKKLKIKDLIWKKNIKLSRPYEYGINTEVWWEQNCEKKTKWTSLSHNGPYFTSIMEPYIFLNSYLVYENKKYELNQKEEQIASFYAKRLISEKLGNVTERLTKDEIFNKNFWNDFKKYLSKEHRKIFKNFRKIGWDILVSDIEKYKNIEMSPSEKIEKKIKNLEKKHKYGYALLDGRIEKIGNFIVEPQAIFYGRGDNLNRGKIKAEIMPEDVTINIGENDPIPKPPNGHLWGDIVNDHNASWLAKWNDSITDDIKYVMFSNEGRFKGESDLFKYEKARKLNLYIDNIRQQYTLDAKSDDLIKKQLGTVLYLIDNFGIRVGNEKQEDEVDTVGASTLLVKHIKFKPPNIIILDFLGKDSVQFYKELELPNYIYKNFKDLTFNKSDKNSLFDLISSQHINSYLKNFDKCFTAKVFRTRLATEIMYHSLNQIKIKKGLEKNKIKILFNKSNVKVADVLNHTRNISTKAQESLKELKNKIKILKIELKDARKKKMDKDIEKIKKKIKTLKTRLESKEDVKKVAINTSLNNYIDPRLIVAWTKKNKIDINVIYSSAMIKKFTWAIEGIDKDWDWINSPLIGETKLQPLNTTNLQTTNLQTTNIEENDFKLFLSFCQNYNLHSKILPRLSLNFLSYVYHFSKIALQKNINYSINYRIVNFYEKIINYKL